MNMKIDPNNWLSHLKHLPEDISNYKTCTYLIALEGWRRGLKLKFHMKPSTAIGPSARFSLSDGKKQHFFTVSRGDKVTNEAIRICSNKPLTYKYLSKNNVPIPEGKSFDAKTSNEEIISYAEQIGFPLVLKPSDGSSGRGVITNIKNIEQFKEALAEVKENQGFKSVIVERFIVGEDYRVYVVGDRVVAATRRTAANVIGDGKRTIEELIEIKNKERRKNPFIKNRSIKINRDMIDWLKKSNKTLSTVPEKGERVFLRRQGAYLKERDPVDITDEMSDHLKAIAVKAMKSIPGLTHCDVDMLVNEKTGEGYVNEINSRPQISNHLFPLEGLARDVPKEIIDFYFPETKKTPRNDFFYFDFNPVYDAFRNRNVKELTIPDIPTEPQIARRFRLSGNLRGVNYERWIRRHVIRLQLNGYLKHLKNGKTSIVVSGTPENIDSFRNIITNQAPKKAKVTRIIEKSWDKPIKIGFEFKKTHPDSDFKQLEAAKNEIKKLKKEKQTYENELKNIMNSKTWKWAKRIQKIRGGRK